MKLDNKYLAELLRQVVFPISSVKFLKYYWSKGTLLEGGEKDWIVLRKKLLLRWNRFALHQALWNVYLYTLICIYVYLYKYVYMHIYLYAYAASDDAAYFPVFENKIEESKQLDPHLSFFFFIIYTLRDSFADLMERQIF